MQKWEDVEENRVKRFELENGDVWEKYVVWRQKAEREGKTPYETDCIFEETRSTFSIWCHLKNRIPFEIMLFYERCYEKIRRGVAGVSMMDDLKIFEEQNGSLQEMRMPGEDMQKDQICHSTKLIVHFRKQEKIFPYIAV